jgi:arsenite-transporting ATPase
MTLQGNVPGLTVGRIDPEVETKKYVDKIVAARAPRMTEDGNALLIEDLRSPCTEADLYPQTGITRFAGRSDTSR